MTNHMRNFFGTQEAASGARRLVISNWRSRLQNLICLSLIPDSLGGNARTVMVANIVCTVSVVLLRSVCFTLVQFPFGTKYSFQMVSGQASFLFF